MRTLGDAFLAQGRDSTNNFLLWRLVAASLVVYGHSFPLAAACADCHDAVSRFFHYRYSGDLGLHIFFVISGFLVTASFDSRRHLGEFIKARALRIYPALIVCIAVFLLLGAALTSFDQATYWGSRQTIDFFRINSSLFGYAEKLPGVFEANRHGPAVSGTLWTLWIEARLYLLVALLGVFGVVARRWLANLAIAGLVLLGIFAPQNMILIGENIHHLRLGIFFAAGAALYINRNFIPLNRDGLLILTACTALSVGMPNFEILAGVLIAYAVFFFGFSKKIAVPRFIEDYSYGIYLYGWPIQQLIAHFAPHWGPYKMLAVALPGAWLAGALSWHLVEKRALTLKKGAMKESQAAPTASIAVARSKAK